MGDWMRALPRVILQAQGSKIAYFQGLDQIQDVYVMAPRFQLFLQFVEGELHAGLAVEEHAVEAVAGDLAQSFLDQLLAETRVEFPRGAVLVNDAAG